MPDQAVAEKFQPAMVIHSGSPERCKGQWCIRRSLTQSCCVAKHAGGEKANISSNVWNKNCLKINAKVFLCSRVFPAFPKHSVGLATCPAGSNHCTCQGVTLTDSTWGSALPLAWGAVQGSCDGNCWEDRPCCALEYHGAKTVKSSAKPWLSKCPFCNERCLRLQAKKYSLGWSRQTQKLNNLPSNLFPSCLWCNHLQEVFFDRH